MMSNTALKMEHVSKKLTKGERHDSLRDLIPALGKRLVRRSAAEPQLKDQEFWALDDISYEIKQGEAVGIIGHNGAGKSTMLKHLSGLMRPTKGKITVNGRLSALIEVGAGFHHDLTGRENIFLNGVILGMSRVEIRRKLDEIIDFCGLAEFIDTPVKRYSSGMYARLGFSVAAHLEPDILVIDEVLSVGDLAFQAKGVEKMRSVVHNGSTVIFVSHNLRAVADLCPRSLLLKRGRLIEDGPTSGIIQSYMEHVRAQRMHNDDKVAVIENVAVFTNEGPRLDFDAGEKAVVEITIRAIQAVEKTACVIYLTDDKFYEVFNTSSERLGLPPLTLAAGESKTFRFELNLHLAAGTFHLCASFVKCDIEQLFDELAPGATLFIRSPIDVRGAVNLYPTATLTSS